MILSTLDTFIFEFGRPIHVTCQHFFCQLRSIL